MRDRDPIGDHGPCDNGAVTPETNVNRKVPGRPRVLLVEDDGDLRGALVELLRSTGFDVEEALANAPERSGDHFVVPAVLGDADDT